MISILTRLISFLSGKVALLPLPLFLRKTVFTNYARLYGANLEEPSLELESYRSLSDFFSRALVPGARSIASSICSPADGRISGMGKIVNQEMIQAKGKNYTLGELLLDGSLAAEFEGGSYFTVYLAPGDYHRVHCPVSGELTSIRHIPGAMFPVSPTVANRRERLFSRNERVCLLIDSKEHGKACVVFVGALNVGSISLNHVELKTNNSFVEVFSPPPFSVEFLEKEIAIGEELGKFHLGSTVVVITAKEMEFKVGIGDKVKMGQGVD
jgi:phosphatidylserine decarboxylase